MNIINILIAILVFSVLIFVHEMGHFLLAKAVGIGVTEFSIGMGPRLLSWGKGETKYSLKLIPFGGSCAMVGEDEDNPAPNAFGSKPAWARFLVILAGPAFNLIFAFLISVPLVWMGGTNPAKVYTVTEGSSAWNAGLRTGDVITRLDGHGISLGREIELITQLEGFSADEIEVVFRRGGQENTVRIDTKVSGWRLGITYTADGGPAALQAVQEGSPAAEAGLRKGDVLLSVDGTAIADGSALQEFFAAHALDGSPVTIVYLRDGAEQMALVTPAPYEARELGFGASYLYEEITGPLDLIRYCGLEMGYWLRYVFLSLKMLVTGRVGLRDMSGAIGIVDTIGTVVEEGMESGGVYVALLNIFMMMVLLNVNLGVMNLLPIPALDGGRLVFILIEWIRGKPLPAKTEAMIHSVGLILLLILLAVIMVSDVLRLFGL